MHEQIERLFRILGGPLGYRQETPRPSRPRHKRYTRLKIPTAAQPARRAQAIQEKKDKRRRKIAYKSRRINRLRGVE